MIMMGKSICQIWVNSAGEPDCNNSQTMIMATKILLSVLTTEDWSGPYFFRYHYTKYYIIQKADFLTKSYPCIV